MFQLIAERITIGRQASSQLCVGDPSVSRQHCIIEPSEDGFRLRDLGSNNGTFVNAQRVEECNLADGDKVRIGDTLFHFAERAGALDETLELLDNGIVANSRVELQVSDSTETVAARLFDTAAQGGDFARRAKAFLKIGAAMNTWRELEALQIELLKQILEVVSADQAAVVLLGQKPDDVPVVTGWDHRSEGPAAVPVSRTLVTKAIRDNAAMFSDDVTADEQLADVSSLSGRNVVSVIVVPLAAEDRTIGAIYLDSTAAEKPLNRDDLEFVAVVAEFAGTALERTRRLKVLKEQNQRLQSALRLEHSFIGCSDGMRQITERIARIAHTDATVMIRGETGTGKELAARAIHQNSARAARPFEAVNCSLLRDTLLESDLFGHEKGSFTGAVAQKKGRLELADGGTLFMDELAELGEGPQAMLLRVLQTREFQRLGGSRTIRADVRIIAATNEDLEAAVRNKTFRQDLYYRLNVVSLRMPPLRERRDDIALLADHFVDIYSRRNKREVKGVSTEALTLLTQYDWPGNVRELENAIEYAVVFGLTDEILLEDLPDSLLDSKTTQSGVFLAYHDAVREAKRNIVRSAMEKASDNYGEAARLLGIHVNNLHRLIRELDLRGNVTHTRAETDQQR